MSEKEPFSLRAAILEPFLVWIGLCVLLTATIGFSYLPLGPFNLVVGLGIATVKVLLIAAVFMELLRADGISRLAAALGFLWLIFLFMLTFTDYLSR